MQGVLAVSSTASRPDRKLSAAIIEVLHGLGGGGADRKQSEDGSSYNRLPSRAGEEARVEMDAYEPEEVLARSSALRVPSRSICRLFSQWRYTCRFYLHGGYLHAIYSEEVFADLIFEGGICMYF